MRDKSVLLLGSYGQSNLGDDLLMWNYLEFLRDKGFTKIYVNANTTEYLPAPVKDSYPDLKIVNTYKTSLIDYVKLIKKVDAIVYGGGTLYKELYSSTGRSPYSVIIRMMGFNIIARLLGARLYHLHIGIGSLETTIGKFISKCALQAATLTVFRDQKSYDIAKNELKISPTRIMKSTDGLFINHVWEKVWDKAPLLIDRKKYPHVIGINVLSDIPDWVDREQYIAVMREFVKEHISKKDTYLVFIPFQTAFNPRNDLVFTEETFGGIVKNKKNVTILHDVPINYISSYLQLCDVFVGMRFHSLLLSAVAGVPFVAVAYDTKCWRFIEEANYPYAIELEKLTLHSLQKAYENARGNQKETKQLLDGVAAALYKEAEEGLRKLHL
ncbi:MAG TPA: polysaccharide pyruvyl transferase family protein [Candidatus Saccharimonadales bacterium]|nr:polysaccharide pyruvyl transferase family protein [Candidatus Saccharimonadales bacterium]